MGEIKEPTAGNQGVSNDLDRTGSKFEMFFDAPYNEIKEVIKGNIAADQNILDIGANKGNLEEFLDSLDIPLRVTAIDNDNHALEQLKSLNLSNIGVQTVESDANEYVQGYSGPPVDSILINATLHEINTPADQEEYLRQLFSRFTNMLKPGGKIIIGDYYYPEEVSDEEVKAFMEYQLQAINHADTRDKFVNPILLQQVATECGFQVDEVREIRAVKEIDRRYYTVVISRK